MPGPESTIESAVCKFARDHGALALKLSGANNRGQPDRLFLYQRRACFIEFKAPGNRPTKLQEHWIEKLCAQGFSATWKDDAEEAKRWLAKHLFGLG